MTKIEWCWITIYFQTGNLGLQFDKTYKDYAELDVTTLPRCLLTTSPTDCINGGATYLFWVKLLDPTEGGILTTMSWPAREGFRISQNGNWLCPSVFRKGASNNRFEGSGDGLVYNTWLQITVVWHNDPKLEAYYDDGFAFDKTGAYGNSSSATDNGGKLVLGREFINKDQRYCSMIIDNINLYNRPLSAEEIALGYHTYA